MTDRLLLWFSCSAPDCDGIKDRGYPRTFMAYVNGYTRYDYDGMLLDCAYGAIRITSHSDRPTNNWIYTIKGALLCKPCYTKQQNDKLWSCQ